MSDSDTVSFVVLIFLVLSLILFIVGLCAFLIVSDDYNDDDFDFKSNTINSTRDFITTEKHLMYFESRLPEPVYSVVDTETGVEYLTVPGGYMIPRYNTDGEIIIHQDLITTTFS